MRYDAHHQHNNNSEHDNGAHNNNKVTLKPALPLLPTMFPRSYSH